MNIEIKGCIFKDSLEINDNDRDALVKLIRDTKEKMIIVVHGTDTMSLSTKYIQKHIKDKTIIFTGAMKPFSLDKVEATGNLAACIGALQFVDEKKVYVCMGGVVCEYDKIVKNKNLGKFELV